MEWEQDAREKFDKMIAKVPVFLREMVSDKVSLKATKLAEEDNSPEMREKDLVNAFFQETPFGFHGPMKADMESLGIDYTQYGES